MTAAKRYPIGISDFAEIIHKKSVYVDKTILIKEIMEEITKVTLITRPRRFGKTLAMSMLEEFLSFKGRDVFEGLVISNDRDFCAQHQNKYPVIFLSFKDAKHGTFEGVYEKIKQVFSALYKHHEYLLEGANFSNSQREKFENIMNEKIIDPIQLSNVLLDLITHTHKHTGIKPIVLIDEYDTPIHCSYLNGFYNQIIEFMRALLGSALKDNSSLEKAVITGIAKISKESMFSGLNNLRTYTILDKKYAQYFGFTQGEVEGLLPISPEEGLIEQIKKWYNGYMIGDIQIYNPWSIIECLSNDAVFKPYWLNTSDNALIYDLIGKSDVVFKDQIQNLIQNVPQEIEISDSLTFENIEYNAQALWTLLLCAGYLKVIASRQNTFGSSVLLDVQIPNHEIGMLYNDIVAHWFYMNGQYRVYHDFIKSLDADNPEKFFQHIQNYISSSMSYFDLNKNTPEHVFHIFMMGLLVGFKDRYHVLSNREAGDGRYDVALLPHKLHDKAIVMEFKAVKNEDLLEEAANDALSQIATKGYTRDFKGNVLSLGMAFCGKKMMGCFNLMKA